MRRLFRSLAIALIACCATLLTSERDAMAQSNADFCRAANCTGGDRRCADLYITLLPAECQEGVMCCPFEEESFSISCYESRAN
jgi:hypothetical protein